MYNSKMRLMALMMVGFSLAACGQVVMPLDVGDDTPDVVEADGSPEAGEQDAAPSPDAQEIVAADAQPDTEVVEADAAADSTPDGDPADAVTDAADAGGEDATPDATDAAPDARVCSDGMRRYCPTASPPGCYLDTDFVDDNANCGGCGRACGPGTRCVRIMCLPL